ncbi:MAG: dTMP kinase [bacterium]|nr:dTMP kinase [bacterium]
MSIEGTFVTIDGPEGAGKSYLARRLIERLQTIGVDTVHTKEPGGTPKGLEYRQKLLQGGLTIHEELRFFFLDREEHFRTVIEPALSDGKFIISDRCSPSTFAYQHFGRGVPIGQIANRDKGARRSRVPDFSLIVDVTVEEGMRRVEARSAETGEAKTTFELEKLDFHRRIRVGFLEMNENPKILPDWNIQIISGNRPKADVVETAWSMLCQQFLYLRI